MKVLSIGRNPDCNIVFSDNMVSRRHALLKVYPNGKYEIVSQGPNGTTVNGNLIVPNQPYPLKRGDMVIFASHSKLDWRKVPDPLKPYKIGATAFGAVAIVIAAILLVNFFVFDSDDVYEGGGTPVELAPNDTTDMENIESPDNVDNKDAEPEEGKEAAVSTDVCTGNDKGTDIKTTETENTAVDPIQAEILRNEKASIERKKAREKQKKGKSKAPATTAPVKKENNVPEVSKTVDAEKKNTEKASEKTEPGSTVANPRL